MYLAQTFGPSGPIGMPKDSQDCEYADIDPATWCARFVGSMLTYDWVTHSVVEYPGGKCIVRPRAKA